MSHEIAPGFEYTWQVLLAWLAHHEALLIFCIIVLEESGIPMPLPADLAMALAGHRVAQGQMSLLQAFFIGQVATLIGSSILYWAGRRGGRPLLFRYGRLLRLNAHRLAQVERLVSRHGLLAVIIGRQIPGLRLAAPLTCGVFRVPYLLFLPAMFIASSVYIGIFIVVGIYGGPAVLTALRVAQPPLGLVISTILLGIASVLLWQLNRRAREVVPPAHRLAASRRRSLEAALLAGLGASAFTSLVLNWLIDLVALAGRSSPERALLRLLESSIVPPAAAAGLNPLRLVFAGIVATVPFQVVTMLLWAIIYAFVFERRLRGRAAVRGLQFALIPWLFTMLVVFPLLGAGLFGSDLPGGALPAVGELLRHAIFGVALGVLYRLVRLARQPRHHEGHRHGHHHGSSSAACSTGAEAGGPLSTTRSGGSPGNARDVV